MSSRYSKMKNFLRFYRTQSKQYRTSFVNYLIAQRQKITERRRKQMIRRVIFWGALVCGGYLTYALLYQKRVDINKMVAKIHNFYHPIMTRVELESGIEIINLAPKIIDELSNIISLVYKYHEKIVVSLNMSNKDKVKIQESYDNKIIFIDLSNLNKIQINEINNLVRVETGSKCKQINQELINNGYEPLFPEELSDESLYDVVVNNLPTVNGLLNESLINMELISSSGNNFRSFTEVAHYGQIPSLNSLFIGTGGAFALPYAVNLKIHKANQSRLEETLFIKIEDTNQKINALRKLNSIDERFIEKHLWNDSKSLNNLYLTCREKISNFQKQKDFNICSQLSLKSNVPAEKMEISQRIQKYNAYFSINNQIFEEFLLKLRQKRYPYSYKNHLLKVLVEEEDKLQDMINNITNNGGIFVWSSNKTLMLNIKPSIDSTEVGAQLMKKIVEVREGFDQRSVLCSHNRYEGYFAKGFFRKMTELFW